MQAEAIQFNTAGIFDPLKKAQFEEFLFFTVNRERALGFDEFHRNVGISRKQWDLFREQNVDVEVEWIIE